MHVAGEYFRIYRWASTEKECSLLRERRPADKRRVGWRRPEVHRRDPDGKQGGGGERREAGAKSGRALKAKTRSCDLIWRVH